MTEAEARAWLGERWPHRMEMLTAYVALLRKEAKRQSLIARSTLDSIWARHIVDSAQLVTLTTPASGASWLDIGSGGGLPGLVVAMLTEAVVTLSEPRRRRADFLTTAARSLGLIVSVRAQRAETVEGPFDYISARAVASIEELLSRNARLVSRETCWVLPRGENARVELAAIAKAWQGSFHVEQSITNPASLIVLAKGVAKR